MDSRDGNKTVNQEDIYNSVAETVIRFKNGDQNSFNEFYELTKRYVYSTVKGIAEPTDVEDLVQDVYEKAFTELKNLENPRAAVKWLDQIAYFKAIDNKKRSYKQHERVASSERDEFSLENEEPEDGSISEDFMAPEDIMDNEASQKILMDMIDELPDVQKQIIRGYFFHEIPLKELAKSMNVRENTAKSHMKRAKQKLRTNIEEYSRRYGIYLRSMAAIPVLSMLFHKEVEAAVVPEVLDRSVMLAVSKLISETAVTGTQSTLSSSMGNASVTKNGGYVDSGTYTAGSSGSGTVHGTPYPQGSTAGKVASAVIKTGISKKIIAGVLAGMIAVGGIGATAFNRLAGKTDKEYIELTDMEIPATFEDFETDNEVVQKTIDGTVVTYSLGEKGITYLGNTYLGGVDAICITDEDTEHSIFGTHIGMTEKEVGTTLLSHDNIIPTSHRNFVTVDRDYLIMYGYDDNNKVNYIEYGWIKEADPDYDGGIPESKNKRTESAVAENAATPNSAGTASQNQASGTTVIEENNISYEKEVSEEFMPFIFELTEGVENRVTLGALASEDVISFNADSSFSTPASVSGNVNGLDFSLQASDRFFYNCAGVFATDLNDKDGYKNIIFYLMGDDDVTETYIFAYNESEIVPLAEIYGTLSNGYLIVDDQHIPENGKFIIEHSTNWAQGDKGGIIFRYEYSIEAKQITEGDSYIGYYSGNDFVMGYPVVLHTDVAVYENDECTNEVGTLSAGTEVVLEKRINNYYVTGGGQSGWVRSLDLEQAARGEEFRGWS